jgi:hypothetical protein
LRYLTNTNSIDTSIDASGIFAKPVGNPKQLWRTVKAIRNHGVLRTAQLPDITYKGRIITTPEEKARLLGERFFPPPVAADLSDIDDFIANHQYPNPINCPDITAAGFTAATQHLKSGKAPGSDNVNNEVVKRMSHIINPLAVWIFNKILDLGYHPRHFKQSITIPLKKPGESKDGTLADNYRPIALLNTLGKVFEAIMATRISYLIETHDILPLNHIGGRNGLSCEVALHTLTTAIHKAWDEGKSVTMLSLDISGAFDNVSHPRLIHNLKQRKLGGKWSAWVESFLQDRTTIMKLPEHTTDSFAINLGIPQGSPACPNLFPFYNAELLEIATEEGLKSVGWIDDITVLAIGESGQENITKLQKTQDRFNGWSRRAGSVFAPHKFQLVHFFKPGTKITDENTNSPLMQLATGPLLPSKKAKLLGVVLDNRLTFKDHLAAVKIKALVL